MPHFRRKGRTRRLEGSVSSELLDWVSEKNINWSCSLKGTVVVIAMMLGFSWVRSHLAIWEHGQYLSSHKLCIENNPAFSGHFTGRTALKYLHLQQILYHSVPSTTHLLELRIKSIFTYSNNRLVILKMINSPIKLYLRE